MAFLGRAAELTDNEIRCALKNTLDIHSDFCYHIAPPSGRTVTSGRFRFVIALQDALASSFRPGDF